MEPPAHLNMMSNLLRDAIAVFLTLTACTALGFILNTYSPLHRVDIAMVFLLGVVVVSLRVRSRIALLMPILAVGTFIAFFVPPALAIVSGKTGYIVTLIVMFSVAVMISGLVERLRREEVKANDSAVALEIEQIRGELLSSVSHDLRAPLASISGAASSLMAAELDQKRRQDLASSIFDQSQRLNRVLKNTLEITRLEDNSFEPQCEWHDIEELIGVALNQLESELSLFDVDIEMERNLPLFFIDGVLIEQLLLNLLDNAVKYSEDSKTIHIKAYTESKTLVLEVQNSVVEMSLETEQRLFQKFFRAPQHAHLVGSGLGLTICRAIAELHDGTITARLQNDKLAFVTIIPAEQKSLGFTDDQIVETQACLTQRY